MQLAKPWNKQALKQLKLDTGQALLHDEPRLVAFRKDFSNLITASPLAVSLPKTVDEITSLIQFANQNHFALTIRGKGLSQGGQSLTIPGGVSICMQEFTRTLDFESDSIWVEANCTWADLLAVTLKQSKAPKVLPYNCNLSVGGVLSAGGVGASSFKYGFINAYVEALEVVDGRGICQVVDKSSPLFHACLSGQGRFGLITKAKIALKKVKPNIKTFSLVYTDEASWFEDLEKVKEKVDYMELICSPAPVGASLKDGKRTPLAQWLYAMHLSIEYDTVAPELRDVSSSLKPWKLLNTQEESIASYFLRHNGRFEMMKNLGQWELLHPWYECYVPLRILQENLERLLAEFPLHYANIVHVVPIAPYKANFLMFPKEAQVCSLMILNPGIPEVFKDSCLKIIRDLDNFLLEQGCKRYLSGFMGESLPSDYWKTHFGEQYGLWMGLKQEFDPKGIFRSLLHG